MENKKISLHYMQLVHYKALCHSKGASLYTRHVTIQTFLDIRSFANLRPPTQTTKDNAKDTYLEQQLNFKPSSLTYGTSSSVCQPNSVAEHRITPKSMPVGPPSVTGLPTLLGFTLFGTQMEVLCTVYDCGQHDIHRVLHKQLHI
jgi:hypothetical protein